MVEAVKRLNGSKCRSAPPPAAPDPEQGAMIVRDLSGAAVLAELTGGKMKQVVGVPSYKLYRDELLAASGNPNDPLEIFLIEQLTWAHHRIGFLHTEAAQATTPEAAAIYTSAAAKLMGECRRGTLALREYRAPLGPKHVTLVNQQNVAAGDQQVALIDNAVPSGAHSPTVISPETQTNLEDLRHEQTPIFTPSVHSEALEAVVASQHSRNEATAEPESVRSE